MQSLVECEQNSDDERTIASSSLDNVCGAGTPAVSSAAPMPPCSTTRSDTNPSLFSADCSLSLASFDMAGLKQAIRSISSSAVVDPSGSHAFTAGNLPPQQLASTSQPCASRRRMRRPQRTYSHHHCQSGGSLAAAGGRLHGLKRPQHRAADDINLHLTLKSSSRRPAPYTVRQSTARAMAAVLKQRNAAPMRRPLSANASVALCHSASFDRLRHYNRASTSKNLPENYSGCSSGQTSRFAGDRDAENCAASQPSASKGKSSSLNCLHEISPSTPTKRLSSGGAVQPDSDSDTLHRSASQRHSGDRHLNLTDLEVTELVGKGHFGEVYEVRHRSTGELLTLKRYVELHGEHTRAFLLEAQKLSSLWHANVQRVLSASFDDQGRLHVVAERIGGAVGSLRAVMAAEWIAAAGRQVFVASEVAQGLAYLHSMGLVHRDLNSSNVIIREPSCSAVIVDVGLPRCAVEGAASHAYWLAPEVLSSPGDTTAPFDRAADLFSYGILALEVVTRCGDPSADWLCRTADGCVDLDRFETAHAHRAHTDQLRQVCQAAYACLGAEPLSRPDAESVARCLRELVHADAQPQSSEQHSDDVASASSPVAAGSFRGCSSTVEAWAWQQHCQQQQLLQQQPQLGSFQAQASSLSGQVIRRPSSVVPSSVHHYPPAANSCYGGYRVYPGHSTQRRPMSVDLGYNSVSLTSSVEGSGGGAVHFGGRLFGAPQLQHAHGRSSIVGGRHGSFLVPGGCAGEPLLFAAAAADSTPGATTYPSAPVSIAGYSSTGNLLIDDECTPSTHFVAPQPPPLQQANVTPQNAETFSWPWPSAAAAGPQALGQTRDDHMVDYGQQGGDRFWRGKLNDVDECELSS